MRSALRSLALVLFAAIYGLPVFAFAQSTSELDLTDTPASSSVKSSYIDSFASHFSGYFTTSNKIGTYGARDLILRLAKDGKNVAIGVAIIYFFIGVFQMLFSNGSDQDLKKWRAQLIWASIAIVIMQSSYSIMNALYGQDVGHSGGYSATQILQNIVWPFIKLMQTLAAFAFLAMAFYAFFNVAVDGGSDQRKKKAQTEVIFSVLGFIVVKASEALVYAVYGKPSQDCVESTFFTTSRCLLENPNVSDAVRIGITIINFFNSFIAIIIVLMVIYAGFLVLTAGGDAKRLSTAKNIMIYIGIGLLMLVASYAIFNFFVLRDIPPVIPHG